MTDENTRRELKMTTPPDKRHVSSHEAEAGIEEDIEELDDEYAPNKIDVVGNYGYRRDRYPFRETLRTAEGKTTLMEERLRPGNERESHRLEPFDPSLYARVDNNVTRSQDVLRNVPHIITTLHGARTLMDADQGNQEVRIKKAMNLEKAQETKFDSSLYNPAAEYNSNIPYDNHSDEKSIITSFINKSGDPAGNPLGTLLKHLNLHGAVPNHPSVSLQPQIHFGQTTHGDAGLPIGEKQF
jgi:hypothetical protein